MLVRLSKVDALLGIDALGILLRCIKTNLEY